MTSKLGELKFERIGGCGGLLAVASLFLLSLSTERAARGLIAQVLRPACRPNGGRIQPNAT
jgi:hypothetical protein